MGSTQTRGRLAGKTCLVTGAAQGIGRAIVAAFSDEGAHVIATDRRFVDDATQPTVTRSLLDVTNEDAVADAAKRFPDVSVLVNCVGFVANGTILETSMEDFDRSFGLNVRSMTLTIRAFLPAMIARGGGSIVNIASVVSSVMAAPNRFAYATSKAAVVGLTTSVALDYVKHGIRCNAISPGTVETPSLHERWAASGDADAARGAFIARQPMGRLGRAEEIAAAAILLASDEATFMTGANVIVDGGMSL